MLLYRGGAALDPYSTSAMRRAPLAILMAGALPGALCSISKYELLEYDSEASPGATTIVGNER